MMRTRKIVAIIQARMGSTRLPGKTLAVICGKPVLQHIIERVGRCATIEEVVVATTENPQDDAVVDLCRRLSVKSFRGSENDVLDRFFRCAEKFGADVVVRITADCPFIDPDIVDVVVNYFLQEEHLDYVSNARLCVTFPDGLDVEVFSFDALKKAWSQATLSSEREHVTPYIWKNNRGLFNAAVVKSKVDLSNKRWTLDNQEDLRFVKAVYEALYKDDKMFKMNDILLFLKTHPEIESINSGIMRDEGYRKSLNADKMP